MNDQTKQFKILAVDDNSFNLKVVGSLLKEAGYMVGFAMNGEQALEVLKESPDIDLVLMDVNMPVLDGYGAFEIIRKNQNEVPVIFLTAYHNIDDILKAFEMGAVDYITKPFNSKELLSRVNTQLQLKHKTDQLRIYTQELEVFNATKDKFFSIISHDLRSPFGALQIIGQMLESSLAEKDYERTTKLTEMLNNTIQGGHKLLDNLLQWSRSQAGKMKLNILEIQLSPVVEDTIALISAQAYNKGITIQNQVDENSCVEADVELLKTVLRNLISNAVKFTPSGGCVSVDSRRNGTQTIVSVKDTGLGFNEHLKQRLFRIDGDITSSPGTNGEEGTGLGLLICKEFVDKMKGKIWVESETEKGSEFFVSLPFTANN